MPILESKRRPLNGTSRPVFRVFMNPEAEFGGILDVQGTVEGPGDNDDAFRREVFKVSALSNTAGEIGTSSGSVSADTYSQQEAGSSDFSVSFENHEAPSGGYIDLVIVASASIAGSTVKVGAFLSHLTDCDVEVL